MKFLDAYAIFFIFEVNIVIVKKTVQKNIIKTQGNVIF